jgi:hypothetical protein
MLINNNISPYRSKNNNQILLPKLDQNKQPSNYNQQANILNKDLIRGRFRNNIKEKDKYNYDISFNTKTPDEKNPVLPYRVFHKLNKKLNLY